MAGMFLVSYTFLQIEGRLLNIGVFTKHVRPQSSLHLGQEDNCELEENPQSSVWKTAFLSTLTVSEVNPG